MTESKKWKMWRAVLDVKTCKDCREKHGKIYKMSEIVKPRPPLHINCRCIIEKMKVILAGNATNAYIKANVKNIKCSIAF